MTTVLSTCENPEFPNWMWRYNRDKCLDRLEPWTTRAERWPPRYRHMGMHGTFQFREPGVDSTGRTCSARADKPDLRLSVNYAQNLKKNREVGFGNGALGNPPGPAPPRLFAQGSTTPPYSFPDLLPINVVYPITNGISLKNGQQIVDAGNDFASLALDPPHYLQDTLNQTLDYPGTFPYYTRPLPHFGQKGPARECNQETKCRDGRLPLPVWQKKHRMDLLNHARDRARAAGVSPNRLPTTLEHGEECVQLTSSMGNNSGNKCVNRKIYP